ncbi:hypothetical protein M8C21_007382 [Ambrosia artemisiifolia]|uniref:Uncharacterized protein n=1 Tax=Ambrosia artemisiifolia TaxID=4212 RepID=A0AAD5G459_AMBAR|nr:hypothetical protein M8C21_007382 [Ambrosia artemisiifolia]
MSMKLLMVTGPSTLLQDGSTTWSMFHSHPNHLWLAFWLNFWTTHFTKKTVR